MEKLKMQSPDKIDENLAKIAKLFPHVITESKDQEGNITKAIDFDLLKQSLSSVLVEDESERYRLDWPGKKASLLKANTPINKTLRPCREESVNFDTTENLYLEGDNFQVLKILQESYLNKVKMIYIDPPYNTGNDFVYTDKFKINKDEYEEELGLFDEEGGRLFKNTDTNGRFHSDWLSMMYERLVVSRDLLKDDGVIFISIDDNEVHNLRKICDEVFGEENFIGQVMVVNNPGGRDYNQIAVTHEYVIIYSKSNKLELNELVKDFTFDYNDSQGGYFIRELRNRNPKFHSGNRPNLFYAFYVNPTISDKYGYCAVSLDKKKDYTIEVKPYNSQGKESVWRWGEIKAVANIVNDNIDMSQIVAKQKKDGNWNICEKNRRSTKKVKSIWDETMMRTENGTRLLRHIFGTSIFDHPKSIDFSKRCLLISTSPNDIILDFFSGSATTAHAVMQLNAEDGGKRKFIMVQLPEKTDEKSEAHKAGYKTISDIGKERIRRAGKQIMDELRAERDKLTETIFEEDKLKEIQDKLDNLDIGFRVYKTDSSNMKDVFYHPNDYEQMTVDELVSNTKEDRSAEDLLTQVILDLGLELNLPIEKQRIKKNDVYFVLQNSLVACFDDELDFDIVDEIAKVKPLRVVFKDASFRDDKDRINLESRFKRLSPDTLIKVL